LSAPLERRPKPLGLPNITSVSARGCFHAATENPTTTDKKKEPRTKKAERRKETKHKKKKERKTDDAATTDNDKPRRDEGDKGNDQGPQRGIYI
jgi:hypothetical protein